MTQVLVLGVRWCLNKNLKRDIGFGESGSWEGGEGKCWRLEKG